MSQMKTTALFHKFLVALLVFEVCLLYLHLFDPFIRSVVCKYWISHIFICALSDPNTSLSANNIQCFEARDTVRKVVSL